MRVRVRVRGRVKVTVTVRQTLTLSLSLSLSLTLALALTLTLAPQILEFIRSFTVYVEGVGHVCGYALFDFERHGDSRYGAPVSGEAD